MKSLIIIGKNSELSKLSAIYFKDKYEEIKVISMNDRSDWDFAKSSYDIIDFNVVSKIKVRDAYTQLIENLNKKLNTYICISTVMHNKEGTLLLSMYRKYKLMQETWLSQLCQEKLRIIRSPDILDSKMWRSICISDGVFQVQGLVKKQIIVNGIFKKQLLDSISSILNGNNPGEFELNQAYLIVEKNKITRNKDKMKYLIIKFISKSVLLNEIKNKIANKKYVHREGGKNSIVYFAGGFNDL